MTDHVLRAYGDVTRDFLTEVLRDQRLDRRRRRSSTHRPRRSGPGSWASARGITSAWTATCRARRRSVVGKFAAQDATAREFMASSGYPNELCFYRHFASRVSIRAPRCAYAAIDDDGWFTLILEDCAPMEPGDQLRGCTVGPGGGGGPRARRPARAALGLRRPRHRTRASPIVATVEPELLAAGLGAVVPGFLERYGGAFAPDEVAFYERLAQSAGNWFAARPATRTVVHSDYRPDNLLFSVDEAEPTVAVVDWQGFQRGLRDVGRLVRHRQRTRTRRAARARGPPRTRLPRGAGRPGCRRTRSTSAGTTTRARCSRRLLTTIFGAMYGVRTERGDRMFELMGARHARQILDLGADRFLDPTR